MTTNVVAINSVDFDLHIEVPHTELEPRITQELKKLRPKVQIKGFRKGNVPLQLVKKMYARSVAYEVVDKLVQDTYEVEVLENPAYNVIGRPLITTLDYTYEQDLNAVIRFGVAPTIELQTLEGEEITKLVHLVEEEDIDGQIEYMLLKDSEVTDAPENEITKESIAIIDMQRLDNQTKEPVGEKLEGESFVMKDTRIKEELIEALLGKKVGDTFQVSWEHNHDHDDETAHDHDDHTDLFEITVTNVQERILPELTDEFIQKATDGNAQNEAELREQIREDIQKMWDKNGRELLDNKIIDSILQKHDFEIPESMIETYLDAFVKQHKEQNKQEDDSSFDEAAYRESQRTKAIDTVRWMSIRDALIEAHQLTVTEEDKDAHFEELAAQWGNDFTGEKLKELYQRLPQQMEQIEDQLLTNKVVDVLMEQATIVPKSRADFEREYAERKAQETEKPVEELEEASMPETSATEASENTDA